MKAKKKYTISKRRLFDEADKAMEKISDLQDAQEQLGRIEKALPPTYYAGLPLATRVEWMVNHWRNMVVITQRLERQNEDQWLELQKLKRKKAK